MLCTTRHCVTQDCYITSEAVAKLQSKASQQTDLSITSSQQSSDPVGMWAAIAVEWERPCYVDHLNSQSYTIPKMWLTRARRVTAISWHTRLLPAQNNNEKRTSCSNCIMIAVQRFNGAILKRNCYVHRLLVCRTRHHSAQADSTCVLSLSPGQPDDCSTALLYVLCHVYQMQLYPLSFKTFHSIFLIYGIYRFVTMV
jgi:hypothetical protein